MAGGTAFLDRGGEQFFPGDTRNHFPSGGTGAGESGTQRGEQTKPKKKKKPATGQCGGPQQHCCSLVLEGQKVPRQERAFRNCNEDFGRLPCIGGGMGKLPCQQQLFSQFGPELQPMVVLSWMTLGREFCGGSYRKSKRLCPDGGGSKMERYKIIKKSSFDFGGPIYTHGKYFMTMQLLFFQP